MSQVLEPKILFFFNAKSEFLFPCTRGCPTLSPCCVWKQSITGTVERNKHSSVLLQEIICYCHIPSWLNCVPFICIMPWRIEMANSQFILNWPTQMATCLNHAGKPTVKRVIWLFHIAEAQHECSVLQGISFFFLWVPVQIHYHAKMEQILQVLPFMCQLHLVNRVYYNKKVSATVMSPTDLYHSEALTLA